MDCLFCKIIDGSIPSKTIYEDELVKVFLDINPCTDGHCLIIPKNHVVTVNDIDDDISIHILNVEKIIYKLLKEKLNIRGLTIVQNNDLGQEVKHYHVHLIPRYDSNECNITHSDSAISNVDDIFDKIKEEK